MKIQELQLRAFGPFTDQLVDMSQQGFGFHIVYGLNEAGKSSALRATQALLFGFPERSEDDFLHLARNLRVGGRLRLPDGRELELLRRKGRKKTLAYTDGTDIGQEDLLELQSVLGGVKAQLFEQIFGIDHQGMVQGGADLLFQKGSVGSVLFSAGAGLGNLRNLQQSLDGDLRKIYLPTGSRGTLNQSFNSLSALKSELESKTLPVEAVDALHEEKARIGAEIETIGAQINTAKSEQNRLERIQRNLYGLGQRRRTLKEIAALGTPVPLAPDFSQRRREAQQTKLLASEKITVARARQEKVGQEFSKITLSQGVLDQSEAVAGLHQRLGSHRKAQQDKPALMARLGTLRADAEAILAKIGPGLSLPDAEKFRMRAAQKAGIEDLIRQHPTLVAAVGTTAKKRAETEKSLARVDQDLAEHPPRSGPASLRRLVRQITLEGNLAKNLREILERQATLGAECALALRELAPWRGSLAELDGLPVPPLAEIERMEEAFRAQAAENSAEKARLAQYQRELAESVEALQEIDLAGDVPDEETLQAARSKRDADFTRLKEALTGRATDSDQDGPGENIETLVPRIETEIQESDELADRLRREARTVQRRAGLLARQGHLNKNLNESLQRRQLLEQEEQALKNEWERLWAPCAIEPYRPAEMKDWWAKFQTLAGKEQALQGGSREIQTMEKAIQTHGEAIRLELKKLSITPPEEGGAPGNWLESLLEFAQGQLESMEKQEQRRELLTEQQGSLRQELENARGELLAAEESLKAWSQQWRKAVPVLGLDSKNTPYQASELLSLNSELFNNLAQAEDVFRRIQGIDQDADEFTRAVGALAQQVAPELAGSAPEFIANQLYVELTRQEKLHARKSQMEQELAGVEEAILAEEDSVLLMNNRLAKLCEEAQCPNEEALEAVEAKFQRRQSLLEELLSLETALSQNNPGHSMEELETEAAPVELDALAPRLEALAKTLAEDFEPRWDALNTEKGRVEAELNRLDGADDAALLAQRIQEELEQIRHQAREYARLKLAEKVLLDAMRIFRERTQEPVMRRASEFFRQLTRGSFEKLGLDHSDAVDPALLGIRTGGQEVPMHGLSSGTRDQLYLSLRLAVLELYVEMNGPFPLLVDDLLINFDDFRSAATLALLADLSLKTQVVLFTHHEKVVESARQLNSGQSKVYVTTLSSGAT